MVLLIYKSLEQVIILFYICKNRRIDEIIKIEI